MRIELIDVDLYMQCGPKFVNKRPFDLDNFQFEATTCFVDVCDIEPLLIRIQAAERRVAKLIVAL